MITFGKTASRPNYLFGKLPVYFKVNDSYKDGSNEGLLERYLQTFCVEIDEMLSPSIDSIGLITDAESQGLLPGNGHGDFIIHIAELFGNPPNIGTNDQYKVLIRHIMEIIQSKGTTHSLKLFLAIYGYKIYSISESSITMNKYDQEDITMDSIYTYDVGFIFYSGWDLVITDYDGTGTKNPNAPWLALLKEAIQTFITPIFAELKTLTYHT